MIKKLSSKVSASRYNQSYATVADYSFFGMVPVGKENGLETNVYFQKKTPLVTEPGQVSLVHAVNNCVGLPLLTVADMFTARAELVDAAKEMALDLYLGTNEHGSGDWPIEVAQHVLYKKLAPDNITFKSVGYGAVAKSGQCKSAIHSINANSKSADLLVELQFPTSDSNGQTEPIGYGWSGLPVGSNGERGHFVAVRNGLVYDSAFAFGARGEPVLKYKLFGHTKKVYRVEIRKTRDSVCSAAGTAGSSGVQDEELSDQHVEQEEEEEEAEEEECRDRRGRRRDEGSDEEEDS